jgi:hypothetical protein
MPVVGELFAHLDARLFLRFRETTWGERMVNRLAGGVATFASHRRRLRSTTGRRRVGMC